MGCGGGGKAALLAKKVPFLKVSPGGSKSLRTLIDPPHNAPNQLTTHSEHALGETKDNIAAGICSVVACLS